MDARVLFTQQELLKGIPLEGISGINPSDPNFRLQFNSSATSDQITQANTDAQAFNWTDTPDPNVAQFESTVMADVNISGTAKTALAAYLAVIQSYNYYTASNVQAIWQGLITAYSATWLDSNTQTLIEQHASDANMPLV